MFAGHEVASLLYARAAAYIKKFFWSDMVEEWNARDRNPSRQTKQNELSLLVLLVSSAIGREFFCKALGRFAAGDPGVRRAREAASIEGTRRRDVEKVVGKVREERRDEAREDLEMERNLILSQAVDALAERRGINRLNSNLFKSTTLHAAAIATYAACENNASLHMQRRIRASVAYELASLMIIDDAERIERRMRLVDNEDDAFEYATLVAEGAARVLQNARIRGSMRKFAYKLIAYKGGVLDAA